MKTKEAILAKALECFNAQGVETITVRHIAASMGISHGNLCYHYPNKNAIIHALYIQLIKEVNVLMQSLSSERPDLGLILESNTKTFAAFYKYRFLFLDFTRIMRDNRQIKKEYRLLIKQRRTQFRLLIDALIATGIFRKEPVGGLYDCMMEQMFILADFWLPSSEILFEGKSADRIPYYRSVLQALIVPHLTSKGLNTYKNLNSKALLYGNTGK